jgi:DNA polymerase I
VKELLEENVPLFLSPIPDIKRVAIDIEVISPFADAIPRPERADHPVGCVSVVASDGQKRILLLERKDVEIGVQRKKNFFKNFFRSSTNIQLF